MSFATNGIINITTGDVDGGFGNTFSDINAQYGGVAVGSTDSFLGVSANSSVVGNANTMNASVNAGILGRGNTLYDSNYSWIVGGDGKTYNSTPNTTFIPNHYIAADSGNIKTSTGSAAATPRYLQLPGVVAAPSGANDEFTFAIPAGAVSFDSAGEDIYVKKAAGWSQMAALTDVVGTASQITATVSGGQTVLALAAPCVAPGAFSTGNQLTVGTLYKENPNLISAAGTTQGTANTIAYSYTVVTTSTPGSATGVKLPLSLGGHRITISNKSGNDINVYPQGACSIDGLAVNLPVVLTAGMNAIYESSTASQWYTIVNPTLGTANQITATTAAGATTLSFPSSITTPGSLTTTTGIAAGSSVRVGSYYIDTYRGLTAAGLNQGTANGILGSWIVCTSVITGVSEGIALPVAAAGTRITILNKSGNATTPLNVYPNGTNNIDGLAASLPILLPNNACIVLEAVNTSQWYTIQPYLSAGAGTSITYGNGTVSIAGITDTLAATLTAGNSTGANDIVITASQQIKYNNGIRIGGDGVNAGTAGFGAIAVGNNANASGYRAAAYGQNAAATHTDAIAFGVSTATDNDYQIKLGANNTFYVETPGYILSGLQKSCAGGITPGVSALQSVATGAGITTILIKDTLYDWSTPMIQLNQVLLSDLAHVFLVSVLIRGTFGAGLSGRTYTLYLYWNDGTNTNIIGQQDMYVAASAGVFSCTISTGMKTNTLATGQYIYAGLDNTSGAQMDISHYRISATRVA